MLHQLNTNYILCKSHGKYYYGWASFDKEFNSLEELKEYALSIAFSPLRFSILDALEKEEIKELDLSEKPSILNGFQTLVRTTTSSEILKELYENDFRIYEILQNKYCPEEILREESKVLHPNHGNAPWLLRNENLPYDIVNKFTPNIMRYFNKSYYEYLFKKHSAKYDWENHVKLKELFDTGTVEHYNCFDCSGNGVNNYNCNTETVIKLPDEIDYECCPHCEKEMVKYIDKKIKIGE